MKEHKQNGNEMMEAFVCVTNEKGRRIGKQECNVMYFFRQHFFPSYGSCYDSDTIGMF